MYRAFKKTMQECETSHRRPHGRLLCKTRLVTLPQILQNLTFLSHGEVGSTYHVRRYDPWKYVKMPFYYKNVYFI